MMLLNFFKRKKAEKVYPEPQLLRFCRSENEYSILTGLSSCDLLILDDIGSEAHKGQDDWACEKLFSVINARYNDMRSTVYTTNKSMVELKQILGERTFSRICEMVGKCFDLKNVPDFRQLKIMKR